MSELNTTEQAMLWGVIVVAFISLAYAYWLWRDTMRRDKGTPRMQEIWYAIKKGANAYLRQQLRTIMPVLIVLTVALFLSVYVVKPTEEAERLYGDNAQIVIAIGRTIAFILGASFSTLVGQLGMRVAIEGNIRVSSEAVKNQYNGGNLHILFSKC